MANGSAGNVARLYSRTLYSEWITIGGNDSERAEAYLIMARGYEDRMKSPLCRRAFDMHGSNAEDFSIRAAGACEKAGDYSADRDSKVLYYKKALRFARKLPKEDREAKELRISLKIRKSNNTAYRIERSEVVTDINAYRDKKLEKSQHLKDPLRT